MSNRLAPRFSLPPSASSAPLMLPALAHHSTVMLDKDQEVKLDGNGEKQFTYSQSACLHSDHGATDGRIRLSNGGSPPEPSLTLGRAGIERKSFAARRTGDGAGASFERWPAGRMAH